MESEACSVYVLDALISGSPTALSYHQASRRLFCGCDSGLIHVMLTDFFLLDDHSLPSTGIRRGRRFQ